MKIGFIGAGKVGTAFGIYLKQHGFNITGYYSRSVDSSSNAAIKTESTRFSTLNELTDHSDIIFITTTDDQIQNICKQLCQDSHLKQGQYIIHMSGALPSTVLDAAKAFGCYTFSLHPLLAFADIENSVQNLPNAYFCLEGQEEMSVIENLLQICGNSYFKLKPEQKTLYHAAACMISNYLVTLVHNGLEIMENIQIDRTSAYKAMLPLINNTIQNISELGTENALTGPIARGDANTLAKQLHELQSQSKEQLNMYTLLSQETLKLAKHRILKNNSNVDNLEAIIESYNRK